MKVNNCIRIFFFVGLLVLLYAVGIPIQSIIFIGIFMLLFLIFKTKVYKKVDEIIRKNFHLNSRFPEWAVKLIIIIIFVIIYFVMRGVVLLVMKSLGFDIQKIMLDGINRSIGNNYQ